MKSPIKISLQKQTPIFKIAISYITAQKINFIVVKLLPILILFLSFLFHQNLQASGTTTGPRSEGPC